MERDHDFDSEKNLELIGFEIENLMRIRSLKVEVPDGGALVLGGDNESGKTSALRGLELHMAGGEAATAEDPIHGDAKNAKVLSRWKGNDGTRYVCEKQWKKTNKGTKYKLVIRKNDSKKPEASPQKLWSEFLDFHSLDPIKFLRQPESEQLKIITELSGVDLSPFAARREEAYEARKDANREVKRLEGALASTPYDANAPAKETSVKELTAELSKRREHNAEGAELERAYQEATRAASDAAATLTKTGDRIDELQAELDRLLKAREEQAKALGTADEAKKAAFDVFAAFEPADEDEIVEQIGALEDRNAKCRAKAAYNRLAAELNDAKNAADARQADLDAVDAEEAEARATAEDKIPVAGLSIADGHVLYNGKPLSQAGRSASIRVACGIAMAKNRDSRVKLILIDDGETLSPQHQREIVEEATARGFLVIMTMVSGRGPAHVEIVDGVGTTA